MAKEQMPRALLDPPPREKPNPIYVAEVSIYVAVLVPVIAAVAGAVAAAEWFRRRS